MRRNHKYVKVYKIEHEDKASVYRAFDLYFWNYYPTLFTEYWKDGFGNEGKATYAHYCGCRSKKELKKWFPPKILKDVVKAGYKLCVYKVPREDVLFGTHQVAFKRDNAIAV